VRAEHEREKALMDSKQFTGATIDEVLPQIREELGEDAVILSTRRVVRGGIGGFFGREAVEVTAAAGELPAEPAPQPDAVQNRRSAVAPNGGERTGAVEPAGEEPEATPFSRALSARLAAAQEAERALGAPPASPASAYARAGAHPFAPGGEDRQQAIIAAAREAVRHARAQAAPALAALPPIAEPVAPAEPPAGAEPVARPEPFVPAPIPTPPPAAEAPVPEPEPVPAAPEPDPAPAPAAEAPAPEPEPVPAPEPPPPAAEAPAPAVEPAAEPPAAPSEAPGALRALLAPAPQPAEAGATGRVPAALRGVRAELLEAGVAERYLDPLLAGMAGAVLPFAAPGADPRVLAREWLGSRLPVVRDWRARPKGHTIALVGQNGVGKSSTACKLAGRHAAAGLSVGLIAAGPGPHPVLEAHARALGLDAYLAEDAAALAAARTALAGLDLVVIDTAGRSAQDLAGVEELAALLGPANPDEVHLVLPVTSALADLGDLLRRFRLTGVNRLIATKLDETRYLGNLVNFPLRAAKPLAYVADGTEIPGAVRPADAAEVAALLIR
jgi:flagellar biosynthesis protein FlhF